MKRLNFKNKAIRGFGIVMIAALLTVGLKVGQQVHADTVPTISGTVSFNGTPAAFDTANNGVNQQFTTNSGAKFGGRTDAYGHYSQQTNTYFYGDNYVQLQKNAPYPQIDSAATHMPNSFLLDSAQPAFNFSGSDVVRDYAFTTKTLTITVKDDKGNLVPGHIVTARNIGATTVTADDGTVFNADSQRLESTGPANASGVATLSVFPGSTYQVCAATGYSVYNSYCATVNTAVTADTAIEIDYPQPPTISGALRFGGNPIAYGTATVGFARLSVSAPYYDLSIQARTDSNSNYKYSTVSVFGNNFGGYVQYNGQWPQNDSGITGVPNTFTLTPTTQDTVSYANQSIVHDFNFPTKKLTMRVTKADGTPASGYVTVNSVGDNTVYDSDNIPYGLANSYGQSTGHTDVNGIATVAIFPGVNYSACVTTSQNAYYCTPVNISADTTVGLAPIPAAPANLAIPTPTNKPALSWAASAGAASYAVFRNGTQIATATTTSYLDTGITATGTYNYTVKALNTAGQASAASNSVSANVDIAPLVQVTGPSASTVVSGVVTIAGTISSYGNYNLMLYVFNSSSQAVVSRYQYALPGTATTTGYTWDTTGLPNGTYSIVLSAKDAQNNKTAQSTSTVKVTVQN